MTCVGVVQALSDRCTAATGWPPAASVACRREPPMRMAINATPDLVFAAIFFWWASGPSTRQA